MPAFRRGHEAIEEAVKSSGGGFTPFLPQLTWRKDKEEKFILVISPIESTYTVDLHEFIEVGEGKKANGDTYTKFEMFVSRKDRGIGESEDKIEELGRTPRRRTLGVAVELEPTFETVRGRKRPAGFTVKTDTVTRKTDDGEIEFESPRVGMLIQSQKNFFGWLVSFDRTQAPAHETPVQVVRRGTTNDTTYDFIPFIDHPVDFSGLFNNLSGIGYLSEDEVESLSGIEEKFESDFEAAAAIGTELLEKRFAELIDKERYDKFMDPIDELPQPRYGGGKRSGGNDGGRAARPTRRSPRKAQNNDSGSSDSSSDDSDRLARFKELRESVES